MSEVKAGSLGIFHKDVLDRALLDCLERQQAADRDGLELEGLEDTAVVLSCSCSKRQGGIAEGELSRYAECPCGLDPLSYLIATEDEDDGPTRPKLISSRAGVLMVITGLGAGDSNKTGDNRQHLNVVPRREPRVGKKGLGDGASGKYDEYDEYVPPRGNRRCGTRKLKP